MVRKGSFYRKEKVHEGIAGHRPAKAEALRPKIVQGEGWGRAWRCCASSWRNWRPLVSMQSAGSRIEVLAGDALFVTVFSQTAGPEEPLTAPLASPYFLGFLGGGWSAQKKPNKITPGRRHNRMLSDVKPACFGPVAGRSEPGHPLSRLINGQGDPCAEPT